MRDLLVFAIVSGIHFVGSIALVMYVFGAGMARFDSGAPATPTETLADAVLTVLSIPVIAGIERLPLRFPGLLGYIPFVANALVWGVVAVALRRLARTSRPGWHKQEKSKMERSAVVGKPPRGYWIVAGLAVIWMLFGVMAWVMDLTTDEAAVAQFSEAERQLYEARPPWLFAVYAVAIFSGLAGAVALLMRQAWALPALGISLAAVFVQFGYTFFVMGAIERLGAAEALPFPLVIVAIGVALLWFARSARHRGWLR